MKAPLTATEKVQRFLARVPDADAATIAKAKGLPEQEVVEALLNLRLVVAHAAPDSENTYDPQPPPSKRAMMEFSFRAFAADARELAEKRPPARCTSALATVHEMEDLFKQLLAELGEEA